MATRTQHAKRNIITAVINKLLIMVSNFVMRTILIKYLGEVYLGLDSLFISILEILSLSELGIGAAMVYSMYKPLAENDTPAVCALLKLYRTVYRWIALIMTVLGAAIAPFLPIIAKKDLPEGANLYVLYFIYLANTILSYLLFAYRSSLFTANQQDSVNNNIYTAFKVVTTILQAVSIILFRNYYFYCIVLPLTTVFKNLAVFIISNKKYPQYQCKGSVAKDEIKNIKKRCAGMFLHKLNTVFRNSFDSIVISAFLGLTVLGKYNCYYYIFNAITGLMFLVSVSITASIGNSIVVETKEKNFNDFKKFQLLFIALISWLTVCLVACTQPFVKLWVGEEMMFSDGLMAIFCVYFFANHFNMLCLVYRQAAGLWWQDRFRPMVEMFVNLSLNIFLVRFIGVSGVMLSTIFCIVFIEGTWGTSILFKYYFTQEKQSKYMLKLVWYWVITAVAGAAVYFICRAIALTGIPAIIAGVLIGTGVFAVVFLAGTFFLPEFKDAFRFALHIVGLDKKLLKSSGPNNK